MTTSGVPTESELKILQAMWGSGPATVREIQERLAGEAVGYTTVLKLLQLMHGKGLVSRRAAGPHTKAHVYEAILERQHVERRLLERLAGRAFGGSVGAMVVQALSGTKVTAQDIERIRAMLDRLEADRP